MMPGGRLINTPLTKLQSTAGFIWREPSRALKRVTSRRWTAPLVHRVCTHPVCTRDVPKEGSLQRCATAWAVVKVPADGKFPAHELPRRALSFCHERDCRRRRSPLTYRTTLRTLRRPLPLPRGGT